MYHDVMPLLLVLDETANKQGDAQNQQYKNSSKLAQD